MNFKLKQKSRAIFLITSILLFIIFLSLPSLAISKDELKTVLKTELKKYFADEVTIFDAQELRQVLNVYFAMVSLSKENIDLVQQGVSQDTSQKVNFVIESIEEVVQKTEKEGEIPFVYTIFVEATEKWQAEAAKTGRYIVCSASEVKRKGLSRFLGQIFKWDKSACPVFTQASAKIVCSYGESCENLGYCPPTCTKFFSPQERSWTPLEDLKIENSLTIVRECQGFLNMEQQRLKDQKCSKEETEIQTKKRTVTFDFEGSIKKSAAESKLLGSPEELITSKIQESIEDRLRAHEDSEVVDIKYSVKTQNEKIRVIISNGNVYAYLKS